MTLASSAPLLASMSLVAGALEWAPRQRIKAVRGGADTHRFSGNNTLGALEIGIAATEPRGASYTGAGRNGDNTVSLSIRSIGPGGEWRLTGVNGALAIDLRAMAQDGAGAAWTVTGTVGGRNIDQRFTPRDDRSAPIVAALIAFDM